MTASIAALASQLRTLGVEPGGVLLVHVGFRALGLVENGPLGLIAALREAIGPDGTLVMPSWSGDDDTPFDPASSPADPALGVTAEHFWRQPGVKRAPHHFAGAAIGPHADRILSDPLPLPPHGEMSPVGRVHELDGQVLLIGCLHDADTTIHLAELIGGAPYRRPKYITVVENGAHRRIDYGENDHCCQRFELADSWLASQGLQREGRVGAAHARLARSRDIVSVVLEELGRDPLIFLHPAEDECEECNDARASLRG
jgi:aminoglycoside N3'-acetyltransferase